MPLKRSDLVLRAADLACGLDQLDGPALNVHRLLQRRHADIGELAQHALDLMESDQRQEGRADGERGDQAEGDQQPAADAVMPGSPAADGRCLGRDRGSGRRG